MPMRVFPERTLTFDSITFPESLWRFASGVHSLAPPKTAVFSLPSNQYTAPRHGAPILVGSTEETLLSKTRSFKKAGFWVGCLARGEGGGEGGRDFTLLFTEIYFCILRKKAAGELFYLMFYLLPESPSVAAATSVNILEPPRFHQRGW